MTLPFAGTVQRLPTDTRPGPSRSPRETRRHPPVSPEPRPTHRPGAVLYGREAYRELDQKAAELLDSLVGNHALVDGNKRLGWLAVVVFYGLNQVDLDAPDDPAYDLVMSVARRELSIDEIATALSQGH